MRKNQNNNAHRRTNGRSKKPSPKNNSQRNSGHDIDKFFEIINAGIDYSKFKADENGQRKVDEIILGCPVKWQGVVIETFPINFDEEAVKNNAVVNVLIPFINMFSLDMVTPESKYYNKKGLFLTNGVNAYEIHAETFKDYEELRRKLGITDQVIRTGNSLPRKDGYYADTKEYWRNGKKYHEGDVIWFDVQKTNNTPGMIREYLANLSSDTDKEYLACDITYARNVEEKNHRRVLPKQELLYSHLYNMDKEFLETLMPSEEIWCIASRYAKTKDVPGYCVVCKNGFFNILVESFFNENTFENESLIVYFNVVNCQPTHHACLGVISADVGNMKVSTGVRYLKGSVFNWQKRINQEIEVYREMNPDFSPYDDPYSKPYDDFYGDGFYDDDSFDDE